MDFHKVINYHTAILVGNFFNNHQHILKALSLPSKDLLFFDNEQIHFFRTIDKKRYLSYCLEKWTIIEKYVKR